MSEQTTKSVDQPEQLSDILLVMDHEKMKIQAVKGIDKNGKLQTVDPDQKNQSQFMRVDKHGDVFSNFFSNFFRQLKNPTRFSFFKVPASEALDTAQKMQQQIETPTPEGEALLKKHEVKTDHKPENKDSMETTQTTTDASPYRYKAEQIDWETMGNLGLSKEKLQKMNLLDPLLKGYKTNELVAVNLNLGTSILRTDARLSLQKNDDGSVVVAFHGIRKEPDLKFPFFGHTFTPEDKDNLLRTGNMGRVVDLKHPKTGEVIPSIISVDRLTNELVALRTDKIKIPDEIKGVVLNDDQKQTLKEGKPLYLEGMISKKDEPFSATVQYNADKRFIEFLFDRSNNLAQGNGQGQEAPRTVRGKELDDEQYNKFKGGETIYVPDLKDKNGKEYSGYLTFNKETGKTDFSFGNPEKMKEKVQPTEAHKTQVAVNSEGKTNEATSKLKEPLKPEQQSPDNAKQEQQQRKPRGVKH